MQSPLQLTFRSMEHSEALADHLQERADKLERLFDHVIWCHVVVEREGHHRRHGDHFRVSVNVGLPGHDVVVHHVSPLGRGPEIAVESAHRAFDEAERQLEDWVKRQRAHRHDAPAQLRQA